jgi:hypothetical protein
LNSSSPYFSGISDTEASDCTEPEEDWQVVASYLKEKGREAQRDLLSLQNTEQPENESHISLQNTEETPEPESMNPNAGADHNDETSMGQMIGGAWHELSNHLKVNGLKRHNVPARSGFCFLLSIHKILTSQYGLDMSLPFLKNLFFNHITDNIEKYRHYQVTSEEDMVEQLSKYLFHGQYFHDVVDLVIGATPDALDMQLEIFQPIDGNISKITFHPTEPKVDTKTGRIIFTRRPGMITLENHYDAILPMTSDELFASGQEEVDVRMSPVDVGGEEGDDTPLKMKSGRYFDYAQFDDVAPELVDECPYEIDGKKHYVISATPETWNKLKEDGRYFDLNTCKKRGFSGQRRAGRCSGSRYCPNENCTKLSTGGEVNTHHFERNENRSMPPVCFSCGALSMRKSCNAYKVVEFCNINNLLHIYHLGNHKCSVKKSPKGNDGDLLEVVKEHPDLGPTAMVRKKIMTAVQNSNTIADAVKLAEDLVDRRKIANLKNQVSSNNEMKKHPNQQSFEAVAEVKAASDPVDKYLVYSLNSNKINPKRPNFVFKSSKVMGELAIAMDCGNPNPTDLSKECVYFDGTHSRTIGYTAVVLWALHPAMRQLLRFASMEVSSESTDNLKLFWEEWNAMLREIKGDPEYNFNPCNIMVDSNAANTNSIRKHFGEDFAKEKIITCQMHYMKNAGKHSFRLPADKRPQFLKLAKELCKVTTVGSYNSARDEMLSLCTGHEEVQNWIWWWDIRKYNLFPAFRGSFFSGVNLAEAGFSGYRRKSQQSLVKSAYDDIVSMVMQTQQIQGYLQGSIKSTGRAPSANTLQRRNTRIQIREGQEFAQAIRTGSFLEDAMVEQAAINFRPAEGARSKAPDHTLARNPLQAVENVNTGMQDILQQYTQPVQAQQPDDFTRFWTGGPSSSAGASSLRRPLSTGMGQHGCLPASHRNNRSIDDNPPFITFKEGIIRRCYGCKKTFSARTNNRPHNMIFKMLAYRDDIPDGNGGWRHSTMRSNVYFHLNMRCVRLIYPRVNMQEVEIYPEVWRNLIVGHIELLRKIGVWHTLANKMRNAQSNN